MIDHIEVQVADAEASAASYTDVFGQLGLLESRGVEVLLQPGYWPEYHHGYYGVFLRDPDRHNVEAVFHDLAMAAGR